MPTSENDFKGFEYVLETVVSAPICFGSKVPRNTNPIGKGLSPFQKRIAIELFPKTGPGRYNAENYTSALYHQLNKVRSTKGIGYLAGKDERFKEHISKTPSPCDYDIRSKWGVRRKSFAPFDCKAVVKYSINSHPGPGTYDLFAKKCRKTRMMHNLGKPSMIHAVETFCVSIPSDECHKCNVLCEGDYWHKHHTLFLCHLCWLEEKYTNEIYTEKQLKEFVKIRNCSYMHEHGETKAAVRLLPSNVLRKKMRLENYLDLYIKC